MFDCVADIKKIKNEAGSFFDEAVPRDRHN